MGLETSAAFRGLFASALERQLSNASRPPQEMLLVVGSRLVAAHRKLRYVGVGDGVGGQALGETNLVNGCVSPTIHLHSTNHWKVP